MSENALLDKLMVERKKNAERFFKKYEKTEALTSLSARIQNYLNDEDDTDTVIVNHEEDNPDDPELTLD